MNSKKLEALDKLIQAKQLEREALMTLMPVNMKDHIDVIGKEVRAMMVDCLEAVDKHSDTEKNNGQADKPSVNKVEIG